jgi:hypothetical protein
MQSDPRRCAGWLLLLLMLAGSAQAAEVDVYLLAGQSNMQGNAKLADLPEGWLAPVPNCRFYNGKQFVALEPGKTQTSSRPDEFGPELGFARTLVSLDPKRTIYLIKFHRSGQPLHHGWDGNTWVGGEPAPGRRTFYPGESAQDANLGQHYRDLLTTTQAAYHALEAEQLTPRLRAVVWMQGEQDAKHEVSATTYAASLARLKRRIEEDLGAEPVPFVLGQVLPHAPPLARFTHRDEIREQQRRADMRSGAEEAIPGCWLVPTDGMPLQADTVHYNALGQAMLGQALALGVLQAQGQLKMLEAQQSPAEGK